MGCWIVLPAERSLMAANSGIHDGELVGYAQLKKMNLTDVKVLSPPLATKKMYMYLNKKHKGLALKVAESLKEMKRDGSYDRIVKEATAPYLNGSKN